MDVLRGALGMLGTGRPAIALVEGEAGIGKTRLLHEILMDARSRGFLVAQAQGEELERTRPFGALAEALDCRPTSSDPRRRGIAALLAAGDPSGHSDLPDNGTGAVGTAEDAGESAEHARGARRGNPVTVTSDAGMQFRVVDAFVDLVEDLTMDNPLVIGLDDLQWVDPSTLLTLGAIARRFSFLPVGLIVSYRPGANVAQFRESVDALMRAGAAHLVLGRLDEQAVEALVSELVSGHPGPTLLHEIAGAGGNPLFVTELVAAIQADGIVEVAQGRVELTQISLPPSLRLTILRRLGYLSNDVMEALRAAAILGARFTIQDLSIATAASAIALAPSITEAVRARVLEEEGDRLRFRHDLIREALYEDIPRSLRLALHHETGQRLAAAGAPTRLVAEQLSRGAVEGDEEAVTWLATAAREVAPRSPDIAVDLFDRALALMGARHPCRDELRTEHASALMSAGHVAEAESAWRSLLLPGHAAATRALAHVGLGLVLLALGRPRDGLDALQLGIPDLAGEDPGRANGLGWACLCRMWLGDLDGSLTVAEQARAAASASGDHMTAAIATAMFAVVAMLRGELDSASGTMEAGLEAAERSPDRTGLRYPIYAPGAMILFERDQFEQARFALETGIRRSDEIGMRWHLPSYQMVGALERFVAGEWDEAVEEATANVELSVETGESYTLVVSRGVHALICVHRNDVSTAAEHARKALHQRDETEGLYRSQWAVHAWALVQEAQGRPEAAYATLAEGWDRCRDLGLHLEYRVLGPDLVRLALATDRRARAIEAADALSGLAASNNILSLTGAALRCRGMVDNDVEAFQAAVDAYASGPRVFELAGAQEDLGTALLRGGESAQGRTHLDGALATYERLGAQRDVARVDSVLRAGGIRRGNRSPRGRPQFGWSSLTPTEETVARLAAEGLTNPEIGERLYVSRRTIQTHLAHVFTKLGISSRTLLAVEVARRDAARRE